MSVNRGAPARIAATLQTRDGQQRTLIFGQTDNLRPQLSTLSTGDNIIAGGDLTDLNGRRAFRAKRIAPADDNLRSDQYNRTLRGSIDRIERIKLRNGAISAVQLRIVTPDGQAVPTVLGSVADLERPGTNLRPGAVVTATGQWRDQQGSRVLHVTDLTSRGRP